MMISGLSFSVSDTRPPAGAPIPSEREIRAIGELGVQLRLQGRVTLMNQIGRMLQIPAGGWTTGQARLFVGADIRLAWLLSRFTHAREAKLMAANLARANQFTQVNPILALVTAAREHDSALTATGRNLIHSYYDGGLDFLGDKNSQLDLPRSITGAWKPAPSFPNPESNSTVYPARIPAGDQMVIYAAQIGASFRNGFQRALASEIGADVSAAMSRASRIGILVWQAYAFLAPGGPPFDARKTLREQLGQHFGIRPALGYIADRARHLGTRPDLDVVVTDADLSRAAWVRSAKIRAAETLFLECLLKRARANPRL